MSALASKPEARQHEAMKIVMAAYDSRNFSFEAFGVDEAQARAAFGRGLREHGRQYRGDVSEDWIAEAERDVSIRMVELGACYRDGEPVLAPARRSPQGPSR